jgi:hypothetical protein
VSEQLRQKVTKLLTAQWTRVYSLPRVAGEGWDPSPGQEQQKKDIDKGGISSTLTDGCGSELDVRAKGGPRREKKKKKNFNLGVLVEKGRPEKKQYHGNHSLT